MSSLTRLAVIVVFAVTAGCGNDLVTQIDELATDACKCEDRGCADKADEDIRMALQKADAPSKADAEKIMKSLEKAGECIQKHRSSGG